MRVHYLPHPDKTADFGLIYSDEKTETPHCRIHGAMNKVSVHEDKGGFWRCLQGQCKAGCLEIRR